MRLLPKCLNALKYCAFWESTEKPSLKKFLEFRLKEGNLEGEEEEHLRYKCEINTISKYYTETSEIGQKLLTWNQDFKNDKKSKEINHFWDLQDKRQNVHSEKLLFEEEAKMSQNKLEIRFISNRLDIFWMRQERDLYYKERSQTDLKNTCQIILSNPLCHK
ncbi:hypothetical protein C1646_59976 [Rhizophagus diaphanus]|nr:hypothetical protein C1646_59976 [Rhizophagus diaphanus] [Rhizophagus sp. MUCL 43196]